MNRFLFISTIDGRISALDAKNKGKLMWSKQISSAPLISSDLHKFELNRNGQPVRIVPSLNGSIYKIGVNGIQAVEMKTDLISSLAKVVDDLAITGGTEIRMLGLSADTGKVLYESTMHGGSINDTKAVAEDEGTRYLNDILLIRHKMSSVHAVEKRTGVKLWSFSVGNNELNLLKAEDSQPDNSTTSFSDFKISVSNEVIFVTRKIDPLEIWKHQFLSPIIGIWKINSSYELEQIDIFEEGHVSVNNPFQLSAKPSLYFGVYRNQFYIQELINNHQKPAETNTEIKTYLPKFEWNSFTDGANSTSQNNGVDALILELQRSKGFYLFPIISKTPSIHYDAVKVGVKVDNDFIKRQQLSKVGHFTARFENEFDFKGCLGQGGYGIVFQAENKLDKCNYAIKRIKLSKSKEETHLNSIFREIKALAQCEHPNIVRYYQAWTENPPIGWQKLRDSELSIDGASFSSSEPVSHQSTQSDEEHCEKIMVLLKSLMVFENATNSEVSKDDVYDDEQENTYDENVAEHYDSLDGEFNANINPDNRSAQNLVSAEKSFEQNSLVKRNCEASNSIPQKLPATTETFFYIQMELCTGQSLHEWLREKKIEERKPYFANVFKQIVEGVEYIHDKKLIHRDLKPNNIFFTRNKQIKIGDFGLVRNVSESTECAASAKKCRCQTLNVGTQFYMAPEISRGSHYDCKVDIYSLGVIFFELLNSFDTEMERFGTLVNLTNGDYPNRFAYNYRAEYELIRQMLADQPELRPSAKKIKERIKILPCLALPFGDYVGLEMSLASDLLRQRD